MSHSLGQQTFGGLQKGNSITSQGLAIILLILCQ